MQEDSNSEDMQVVVFSYSSSFHDKLQFDKRIFTINGKDLTMNQKWKGDGKGGNRNSFM